MSTLKPWRQVATPHDDIRNGKFDASVFAAHLGEVLAGRGAADYRDAPPSSASSALFFAVPEAGGTLQEEARKLLACEDISGDVETYKRLDDSQRKQLDADTGKARRDLKEAVWRTYKHIERLVKSRRPASSWRSVSRFPPAKRRPRRRCGIRGLLRISQRPTFEMRTVLILAL
jgi:hypothetical protein